MTQSLNAEEPPKKASNGKRGLKIALAISLAFNLAVLGSVAGVALRADDRTRAAASQVRDFSFGPFTDSLSRDQRRALRRGLIGEGRGLRELHGHMRQDFQAILAALRADPFDEAGLAAAVQVQGDRMVLQSELGRIALTRVILGMSRAERAEFANQLEQNLANRGPREGGKEHGSKPERPAN